MRKCRYFAGELREKGKARVQAAESTRWRVTGVEAGDWGVGRRGQLLVGRRGRVAG
jgi:hypothetical protein